MSPRRRRLLSRLLAGLAVTALLTGAVGLYAERALFDSSRFSDRAVSVLNDEDVRARIGAAVADAAIAQAPDLIAARPLIESVAAGVAGTAAAQSLLAAAVADVHETVIEGNSDTVLVTLADVGVLVREGLRAVAPDVAGAIPRELDAELLTGGGDPEEGFAIDLAQAVQDLKVIEWVGLVLALAAGAGSLALARNRLLGIRRLGRALAIGGVAAVVGWQIGRGAIAAQFDGAAADAARAVFDAFLGDLRTWLLVLGGTGLVITAGATSTRDPVDVRGAAARSWELLTATPEQPWLRVARAIALVAAGILVVANRRTALEVAVVLIGAYVVYVGAAELMRMAAGAVRAGGPAAEAAAEAGGPGRRAVVARIAAVGALLVALMVLVGAGTDEREEPPLDVQTCNGSAELCDRPLDQVAFAGTHNSMSAATYRNWFFAQHERGIRQQLDAGFRALLIDPHYGVRTAGGVATDFERDFASREKIEQSLGAEGVAAAERIRERIGYEGGGEVEVFLCHGFCEVGAIDATRGFEEIRDFLVANPHEVVLVSIEDATSPEDTVAAIEAAGLGELIYEGPDGPPWPTLGELIESGRRLVIMAERDGGDPAWYRRQFEITKETPFTFERPEDLERRGSCKPNRGPEDASFFLLNHWIDTSPAPRPTNARIVNQRDFLLDRIRLCERVRGTAPNIIAVDFFEQGDVVGVVEELNRERAAG